jgi:succinate dehydrogenase/fumarate reductase flavoprotein subunit
MHRLQRLLQRSKYEQREEEMKFLGNEAEVHQDIFYCLIIGSGAASYNAAVHLYEKGVRGFAIITENRLAGTSRNTGSDKQTYYKIACAGDQKDSPRAMAGTLFAGGAMDGDLALAEASHSLEEFFHLVSIGVDFPHNRYGEFAGYKTDHDPLQRASSIGPYTSKEMTERLQQAVSVRNIRLIDKTRVIKILTDRKGNRSYGLLCLGGKDFQVYFCKNISFATGGPPGLYSTTVYPPSQFGSSGILAREGVVFSNITEWQYGIASTKFRWNLSGSYQQVIPRYLSVDENGR